MRFGFVLFCLFDSVDVVSVYIGQSVVGCTATYVYFNFVLSARFNTIQNWTYDEKEEKLRRSRDVARVI